MTTSRKSTSKSTTRSRTARSRAKPASTPASGASAAPAGAAGRNYRIRGSVQAAASPPVTGSVVAIRSSRRLVPGTARDAGAGDIEVGSDEVVRIELDNGFVLWTRADDLIRDHGREILGRDGGQAWEISLSPPLRAGVKQQRGWLGLGIKVLEFFGIDVKEKAAGALCKAFEEKVLGHAPGLYRCPLTGTPSLALTPVAKNATLAAAGGPMLMFLHGTASSTEGGFGKLWKGAAGEAARTALAERYGERAFAWEHRTLTHSPIRNALELAQRLPKGAELHLVSHSRGGLVGELLCLGQRERKDDPLSDAQLQALFKADRTIARQLDLDPLPDADEKARDEAYQADRGLLAELLKTLDEREITVTRFVRVACPARGTTLASGRLDRWLSVLDYLTGNGLIGDVADFMLGVVKERTDPRTLPGLEAMMPGSGLTRMLQHPGLLTYADLSVIAGDVEGDGVWSRIKLFVTDWFYGADHDLVVNTGSMVGGIRRPDKGARFLFDQGSNVNHFNYFQNEKSVRWLVAGLTRADGGDGGYLPIQEAKHEEPRWREAVRRSRAASGPRPLAVVVPGVMGSELKVQDKRVWLNFLALMTGGLGRIRIDAAGVEPMEVLDRFYGPLIEFLARSHGVEVFPYDWRLSVRDAAARLAERLEALLPEVERSKQPVHIVAHSMGGLVTRAMIADGGRGAAVWRRILALPNSRFLMLGTPNLGSYEAVRWLTGYNPTAAKLSLLDMTQDIDDIVGLVNQYPGLLELLPFDDDSPDFSDTGLWQDLQRALRADWQVAPAAALRKARETWRLLKAAPADPEHMVYVAGCQPATVIDYRLADYEYSLLSGRQRLEFMGAAAGDGTVSWKSGLLPGVPAWYAPDTAHDALCSQKRALPGYLELLMTGRTTLLPATPPGGARAAGADRPFVMPALPPVDGIPSEDELRAVGLGPSMPDAAETDQPAIPVVRVAVVHGDLSYARYPVMVGHYHGDVIVSAEAALDRRLKRALTRRQGLGLYPGQAGSHAVFFNENPDTKPRGALVIGLGQVGSLSPTVLQNTICTALLDYALQVAQWPDERFGKAGSVRSAAVSCLLVGTGPGGITVRDSVEAILRAAVQANERLEKAQLNDRVLVDRIDFIEIYEDAALAAAKALKDLMCDGQLADAVTWADGVIEEGEGRCRRVRYEEAPNWWHRLEIIEEKGEGGLRFIFATDRARAEVTHATGQLHLAEGFIRQASRSPASNTEVAKTLYEMLLPNRVKDLAPQQGNLVLVVDTASARYPWELIEDRWNQNGRPQSIANGLVRQLKTPVFRATVASATEPTAYVVGNPNLDGWREFPDLPGARDEAQKVAGLLGTGGYRVRDCIDGNADELMDGLHKEAWRILHLAGHGEHEFALEAEKKGETPRPLADDENEKKAPQLVSGMVIGRNTFLTPGDVAQMRWVPELVFINCCHLGKSQARGHGDYSPLAANLGMEFIRMGVKAVVAAGWAVDDTAATAFAESFYGHLLNGETFGEATRAAREEIWKRFPEVNTWGAYQCYGDPGFRLYGEGGAPPAKEEYQSPSELVAKFDNSRAAIRMEMRDDEEAARRWRGKLAALVDSVPAGQRDAWFARGDVAAAAGFAWAETGDYAEGIRFLEIALRAGTGDCPVRAMEQCANFRVRLAGQRWTESRSGRAVIVEGERLQLVKDIEGAIGELDAITRRAPTAERLNLLGGACKRLAWVQTDKALRLKALNDMARYYWDAFQRDKEENPYPFSNWAVATVLAAALDPKHGKAWRQTLEERSRQMCATARARCEAKPNFWDTVGEADCGLARLLILSGEPANQETGRLADLYRKAGARGASRREFDSVLEHLDFTAELAQAVGLPAADAVRAVRAAL